MGSILGDIPVVGSLTGTSNSGILGNLLGTPTAGASAQVAQVNPQIRGIQEAQLSNANNFQNGGMNNYEQTLTNAATDASRLQTQQQQQQSNTSANARGMLYGGYAQNQSNQIAANNQGALNSQIANQNYGAQQLGQQMNQQAISNGLLSQGFNQQYVNSLYNTQSQAAQQNASTAGGLLGALGGLF